MKKTQAQRIVDRFGDVDKLFKAMKRAGRPRNKATIYKWLLPKAQGGTGGVIPTAAVHDVLSAARLEGVLISETDMWPGEV